MDTYSDDDDDADADANAEGARPAASRRIKHTQEKKAGC